MRPLALFVALLASAASARAAEKSVPAARPRRWAAGVNYIGGQIRRSFSPLWAAEIRFQTGSTDSEAGRVSAKALGLRLYRFTRDEGPWTPFAGIESAYAFASTRDVQLDVSGPVFGVFGGIERRLSGRLAFGVGAGPYLLVLKETKRHQVSQTSVQFVADTYLLVRLF